MLLTISTTHRPATDLGYLLHKNPARLQTFTTTFGAAHVFYPEASEERCTAALLLDVDPVGLVRGRGRGGARGQAQAEQYGNDRPYVSSSFTSVAIAEVFGTAMNGRSKERPELATQAIPLEATVAVLPARGGEELLRRLFEPLGYTVSARRIPLDEQFPEWGEVRHFEVQLAATCRLADLLGHLYVLIPVLDADKHYWIGADEVDKLLKRGETWLAAHPERAVIVERYLGHRRALVREALDRLLEDQPDEDEDEAEATHDREEAAVEERISLNEARLGAVVAALKASGARRVLDLGCGEGRLMQQLIRDPGFEEIVGMDVSNRTLQRAAARLKLDRLPEARREKIRLLHGSLTYRDARLAGFDAAAVVEVVEHLDPHRLAAFQRSLFGAAAPATVVLTTPNREYNVRFPSLPAGTLRHKDHRFEWTRTELQDWAAEVAAEHGYSVRFLPVGEEDPEVGPPTQMAVFAR